MILKRDVELANLLNDFFQRDGYAPLKYSMLLDLQKCLSAAREEGRREIRNKVIDHAKAICDLMANSG